MRDLIPGGEVHDAGLGQAEDGLEFPHRRGGSRTVNTISIYPRNCGIAVSYTHLDVYKRQPYITAFFMPRRKGDRPDVIPDGCVNFAFLGQFAETPRDTIFTTEYSCLLYTARCV